MSKFDPEIVSGNVFRSIWKIAWPVIITQLVAGIHGIIDHILVGRYVGYEGQAAIGVSWQLFLVVIVFLSSLFHGMNIFIAQYAGRGDHEAVNRVWTQVLTASIYLLIFIVAPGGYFLAPHMLSWIEIEPGVQEHAVPYLRILFTCSVPTFVMFIFNWALQAGGNPKIPMFLGIVTTITNVAISYALITGAGPFPAIGTSGAAVGTAVAPIPALIACVWLIGAGKVVLSFPAVWRLWPDWHLIRQVAAVGIPAGIQAVLLNVGGAFLMYFINQLDHGSEALAAYTVCYAQIFSVVTWTAFGLRAACATVMGQNIGAGKVERGKHAVYLGAGIAAMWAGFFGTIFWFFSDALLAVFALNDTPIVGDIGHELLRYLAFSGFFVAVTLAFTGGLQGAGDTKKPMYIAFITQIIILLGMCFVLLQMGRLTTNLIWTAILTSHITRFALTYGVFFRGKWEHIRLEIRERQKPIPVVAASEEASTEAKAPTT